MNFAILGNGSPPGKTVRGEEMLLDPHSFPSIPRTDFSLSPPTYKQTAKDHRHLGKGSHQKESSPKTEERGVEETDTEGKPAGTDGKNIASVKQAEDATEAKQSEDSPACSHTENVRSETKNSTGSLQDQVKKSRRKKSNRTKKLKDIRISKSE